MDQSCFVYVIESTTRNFAYPGLTFNVDRRVAQHNSGRSKATAAYRPFNLILVERFPDRIQARNREKFLKSGQGREWLKQFRRST